MKSNASPNVEKEVAKRVDCDSVDKRYKPFITEGFVSLDDDSTNTKRIHILRDTGATQSLLLEGVLPLSEDSSAGASVLIQGVELGYISVPLHVINLKSDLVSGTVTVGVRPSLPVEGISLLLGNDIAGDKVAVQPLLLDQPKVEEKTERLEEEFPGIFPACVTTRSMAKRISKSQIPPKSDDHFDLSQTFLADIDEEENIIRKHSIKDQDLPSAPSPDVDEDQNKKSGFTRYQLIQAQKEDPEVSKLIDRVIDRDQVDTVAMCYFKQNGILMRKWRPPDVPAEDEWKVMYQIVVRSMYHNDIISLAHETTMAGHLGVTKTHDRIIQHFYWPKMKQDVSQFCKTCRTCQK